jgi:1,4-dihydroxy-2-naphthoate octaprenyltransferase
MAQFIRALRAPFFTATVTPGLLGAIISWSEGRLHLGYLLLTVIGIIAINAALNTTNDYYDHVFGDDEANKELTPFSGGSRVIQEGVYSSRQMLGFAFAFYALTIAIGLYLVWVRGTVLLWIGLLGVLLAVFSSAPPLKLNYRGHGLGELAAGIGCGPLIVLGSYYVQAQRLTLEAFWASLPLTFLVIAILYINEFPDYAADKAVGKNTLVVVLGKERAVWGYIALLLAAYLSVLLGVALSLLPWTSLLALLTVPLAPRAIAGARRFYDDTSKLIPTNALTIQTHLASGALLCMAYALARWL